MSYMALYRKWRPDEFEEVKGQEHIVTTLKNQIKYDRIGHAYLFCGTRGTGKTTVAKLLAKAVNCEHPIDGSPCNECESCKSISRGTSMNVVEIDAASNNGVDNIRQINEAVQYSPTQGKYLVYIIDEVHMLSAGAFNALLKTLEEPPEYVIFILATTESHKIPITIMSRCQRYDFRRISIETISERLADLLKREDIPATKEALDYVAKAADGSMRDALSILDQCIAFNLGEELTYDRVLNTIGAVDIEVYTRMTEAISEDDINKVLDIINEIIWQGRDLNQFVNDFVWFMRNMLFLKISPAVSNELDMTSENVEKLTKLSEKFKEETMVRYLNILQELSTSIKYSTTKRVTLEMAMIKLCKPETSQDYSSLIQRLDNLEKKTEKLENMPIEELQRMAKAGGAVYKEDSNDTSMLSAEERSELVKKNIQAKYSPADAEEILKIIEIWKTKVVPKLSVLCQKYIDKAEVVAGDSPSSLNLVFYTGENIMAKEYFDKPEHIEDVEHTLKEMTEKDIKVKVLQVPNSKENKIKYGEYNLLEVKFDIEVVN